MTTAPKRTPARPRPRSSQPLTFADVRARIQRPRRIVEMVMDAAAAAEIFALEDLLERARRVDEASGAPPTAPDVAKRLQEAEQQAADSRVRFVLDAVPHRTYQALRREHPPTKEQIEQAAQHDDIPAFDPDTFAPALVYAQLTEPRPDSREEFDEFWAALSDGQVAQVWSAALGIQFQAAEVGTPSQAAAEVLNSFGLPTT